jgi:hypothetical protein
MLGAVTPLLSLAAYSAGFIILKGLHEPREPLVMALNSFCCLNK